jgi:hypothetical protein
MIDLDDDQFMVEFVEVINRIRANPVQFREMLREDIAERDALIDNLLVERPKGWEHKLRLELKDRNYGKLAMIPDREIDFSALVQHFTIQDLGEKVNLEVAKEQFLARMKTPDKTIKVLIADPFEPSIRGIRYLLSIWSNLEVQWVSDGWDCENLACNWNIDILLLDHNLSSRNFNNVEDHCFCGDNYYSISIGPRGYDTGGFRGQLISIANQLQPYSVYNFTQKMHVTAGYTNACLNFIDLINQFIL